MAPHSVLYSVGTPILVIVAFSRQITGCLVGSKTCPAFSTLANTFKSSAVNATMVVRRTAVLAALRFAFGFLLIPPTLTSPLGTFAVPLPHL